MKLKVRSGTVSNNGENLCRSCRSAWIRKDGLGNEIIRCQYGGKVLTAPTVECSEYENKSQPLLYEMEKIAWLITGDGHKEKIGFIRIRDLSEEEKDKLGL